MARTVITPQQLTARGGAAITFQAVDAANGMTFANTGREVVIVEMINAADQVTITIPSLKDPAGRFGDVGSGTVSGGSATTGLFFGGPSLREEFGPFDPTLFGDGVGNLILNFTTGGSPVIAVILIP